MNAARILVGCAIAISLLPTASAQVPINSKVFELAVASSPWEHAVSVHAESLEPNVTVEHWVVPHEHPDGIGLDGTMLQATDEEFETSDDFLAAMQQRAERLEEHWLYARQEVVYLPLSEAREEHQDAEAEPIACHTLLDEAGDVVGRQVRTEQDGRFTDHWVLYADFEHSRDEGLVTIVGDPLEQCDVPAELLAVEAELADERDELHRTMHATTTFSLDPLASALE